MARKEIRIVDATCDACAENGQDTKAVDVIRVGATVYDLCKAHQENFVTYFADLFKKAHQEPEPDPRPAVVITGNIRGYTAEEAREAAGRLGYRIAGHVDADTALIICGTRPASHKVREAKEHGTPVLDATDPRVFGRCIAAGKFTPSGELPKPKHKTTAADERPAQAV
ncbi:hypothetical protein [Streptomyces noursei]|uniref:hypothetical protein n=1 Tax=Streptomyces noursei TaxID=1971 RepID=UPI001678D87C|nr:hypothetical protein [Streptomyces noursei]MCZ1015629.1 hypothetical protein [Streptomyces noursei]GGW89576.1 hypothetical protein GCM10010341_08020 [Streptomyces noursei]